MVFDTMEVLDFIMAQEYSESIKKEKLEILLYL